MFHLTAAKCCGSSFSRDALGGAKVAIIGFCPMPTVLKNYSSLMPLEQFSFMLLQKAFGY